MGISKVKWFLRGNQGEEDCQALSCKWKLSPLVIKLILNRGVKESYFEDYLFPSFDKLHDPFLMKGMREAVNRILLSISRGERILIYGDYDVDGITATSLLLKFMKDLKFPAYYYIPHRQNEGYGLNKEAIKKAFAKNIKLIITCDCGTSSLEEIRFAHSLGIEVIVTDHHQISGNIPPDFIVVNPHNPECNYPFKELSGVGVAFKLCQAIAREVKFPGEKLKTYLDLVAIGTLADIVALIGENRILVKAGLEILPSQSTSPGLRALINTSGLSGRKIEEKEVGYILAPRLNACGRLSLAKTAVKLLLSDSVEEALWLARKLNRENSRRQNLEKRMCKEADDILSDKIKPVLVVANKNWHPGVVGLVASYLKEKYYRPALAFAIEKDIARGSARSIPNFPIFQALTGCSELITSFGGHQMAAGLTLPVENIERLENRLNSLAEEMLSLDDFVPCRFFDAEVGLEEIDMDLVKELQVLSPFGPGNPKPVFLAKGVRVIYSQSLGKGEKLTLSDLSGKKLFKAFFFDSFNKDKGKNTLSGKMVDIFYFPALNTWRGEQDIYLEIKGIRLSENSNSLHTGG